MFSSHDVWMKIERMNPGGSIKDRTALYLINEAERSGVLTRGRIILEPTSGNTGIGLAMIGAVKGYKVVLVMSEGMSVERRAIAKAFGADVVLTPKAEGTRGAVAKAKQMAEENPIYWMPFQFENRSNINAHMHTTAPEVLRDFPDGIDVLITASGTGGHISGMSLVLKQHFPALKVYAVEPDISPVISGGEPHAHPIAGISPGFIPKNLLLGAIDGVIQISQEDAFACARELPKTEGIFGGLSTGAALAAVRKYISQKKPAGMIRILTINYDLGERYLSVENLF